MSEIYDVAIIGSGIIGNSIATHLATSNKNLKIAVIDPNSLGIPASIASAGMIQVQFNELENPLLKRFCLESFDYFKSFISTFLNNELLENIDLGYRETGSFGLVFSDYELEEKRDEEIELRKHFKDITYVDGNNLRRIEPLLTDDLKGAFHYPHEAFINNIKFTKALISFNQSKNVTYLNTKVESFTLSKNRIEELILADGKKISAKQFILSNGVWANSFLKSIFKTERNLIKAIKGEIIQFKTSNIPSDLNKIILFHGGYILPRVATNSLEESSIIVGSTLDEVNIENANGLFDNTPNGISNLITSLKRAIPISRDFKMINQWVGLRPKTYDGLPIIGRSNLFENILFALGHYRNGILMAPITGKIISNLILENKSEHNISDFNIDRFFIEDLSAEHSRELFI